jgi:hypothetical protein
MRERRKNAQFLRHLVYDLKRDYGFPVTVVKTESTTVDLESGVKRPTLSYRVIQRAIFLPARAFQSFVYDLTYVATNKNFTSGAFFNPTDRTIFVDARDTDDFEIKVDDRILYNGEEYIVAEVRDFIAQVLFGVKMRHVTGQILDDPANSVIAESVTVTDAATGVRT